MTTTPPRHGGVFASMPPSNSDLPWLAPAIDRGHNFCPDPPGVSVSEIREALLRDPAALSGAVRFTCRRCGDTALNRHSPYGSAFTQDCISGLPISEEES